MNCIQIVDKNYPKELRNIVNSPDCLYYKGDVSILKMPAITVVGSRNMTDYGRSMTKKIVRELTQFGMCIVSGMAIGIDSIAHRTCIENGGKTVAVLGCGLNHIFPPENYDLYHNILNTGGCILSEYPPDTLPDKKFFPQRNRIVSGLSMATLVVEATYRSGTSITANYAFSQGKTVFCVPNSVGNKNSAGTINLIKKGATLVTCGEDILYNLGLIKESKNFEEIQQIERQKRAELLEKEELSQLDNTAQKIYYFIKDNKVTNPENLSIQLNENIQTINTYLSILELKGLIINKYGLNYELRDDLYV